MCGLEPSTVLCLSLKQPQVSFDLTHPWWASKSLWFCNPDVFIKRPTACHHLYSNTPTLATTVSGLDYFNSLLIGLPASALAPSSLSLLTFTVNSLYSSKRVSWKPSLMRLRPFKTMHTVTPHFIQQKPKCFSGLSGFTCWLSFTSSTSPPALLLPLWPPCCSLNPPSTFPSQILAHGFPSTWKILPPRWVSDLFPSVLAQMSLMLFLTSFFFSTSSLWYIFTYLLLT